MESSSSIGITNRSIISSDLNQSEAEKSSSEASLNISKAIVREESNEEHKSIPIFQNSSKVKKVRGQSFDKAICNSVYNQIKYDLSNPSYKTMALPLPTFNDGNGVFKISRETYDALVEK